MLDEQGHHLTIMDVRPQAFSRLPGAFGGVKNVANGMDGAALERSGIREADAFIAVTQGDNRNYFASQMAHEIYRVPRVLCRIYDPDRAELFNEPGLETFSPTSLGAQVMVEMLLGPAAAEGQA
jgi:trk system potassium uptake protein TrkA